MGFADRLFGRSPDNELTTSEQGYFPGDGAYPFGKGPRYIPSLGDLRKLYKTINQEIGSVLRTREYHIFWDGKKGSSYLDQPFIAENLDPGGVAVLLEMERKPFPQSKASKVLLNSTRGDPNSVLRQLVRDGYATDSNPAANLKGIKVNELRTVLEDAGMDPKGTKAVLIERVSNSPEILARIMPNDRVYTITEKGSKVLDDYPYFRVAYNDVGTYLDTYKINLLMNSQKERPVLDAVDEFYSRLCFYTLADKDRRFTEYPSFLAVLMMIWTGTDDEKACRIALQYFCTMSANSKYRIDKDPTMKQLTNNCKISRSEILNIMEDEIRYVVYPSGQQDKVMESIRRCI